MQMVYSLGHGLAEHGKVQGKRGNDVEPFVDRSSFVIGYLQYMHLMH